MEQKLHGAMTPTPESCPHCNSKEIDPTGKCQVCGLRVKEDGPTPKPAQKGNAASPDGPGKRDRISFPPEPTPEIPEWRHELSRRLLEIKRRRGVITEPPPSPPASPARTLPFPQLEQPLRAEAEPVVDLSPPPRAARRAARPVAGDLQDKIVRLPDRAATRQQRATRKADPPLPLFQPALGKAGMARNSAELELKPFPKVTDPDPVELQKLIDTIVIRQAEPVAAAMTQPISRRRAAEEHGDLLILLSRTLSGFVDLLIVGLCTGAFLVSADFFSEIDMIDNVSKIWYSALLLATYLLYSTFFLGTANQTIGMMIKDLRVVGENGKRPKMNQILRLSAAYLVSILAAGSGLLWACFDHEHRCLHDRLSRTRVVRL
jgi:uncharacterized RDD family membrane protein YckC